MIEYKGFNIYKNEHFRSKFPTTKFVFFLKDWDEGDPQGHGESVEDCKKQIDEIIQLKNDENEN